MGFPNTETGLRNAGYKFTGTGQCKSCKAPLAWYETPNIKAIPLDEGTLLPHWTTCPDADKYRDKAVDEPRTGQFSSKTDGYKKKPVGISSFDVAVLMKKLEHSTTIQELNGYAEICKTAPEKDKPILREMYVAKAGKLKGAGR